LIKAVEFDSEYKVLKDHVLLMQLYYENEDYDKCLAVSSKILAHDPKNIDAVKTSAFCYNAQGDQDKALKYYKELLEAQPDDADLNFNMGVLYEQMEQYDNAIAQYEKAFALNPTDADAIIRCAQFYLEIIEDYSKAVESYAKALELKPDDPDLTNNYGIALIRAGEKADDQAMITRGTEQIKRAAELRQNP